MTTDKTEFLWVEKYRPKKIEDCILSSDLKKTFTNMISSGEIQNMILTGTAGVGKTTVAIALCEELDYESIIINGSADGNIDTLRNKIRNFATTVSLTGRKKVVILDEADYLNPQSTQPALRRFIEEYSDNCRFILTCNFVDRIIKPLHSRCPVKHFILPPGEKQEIAVKFFDRLKNILNQEGITYDEKTLSQLTLKHFPDFRRILNECQSYSHGGSIDAGILNVVSDDNIGTLINYIKDKNFTEMRKWIGNNSDIEPTTLYKTLYVKLYDILTKESYAQTILILAKYQYQNAFVADTELNTVAGLLEVMMVVEI